MNKYKKRIRAATLILDALIQLRKKKLERARNQSESFIGKCNKIIRSCNRLKTSVQCDYLSTAEKLQSTLGRDINDFSYYLSDAKQFLRAEKVKIPTLREIVENLIQLEQEFENVKIHVKDNTISVITGNIELEGVYLGPFQIKLYIKDIQKLCDASPYYIIALAPNPAAIDSAVTHPHVSNERLCEGDGIVPIRKAIEQGRLCDFFTIVVNILNTYNPDSPYISLDDWQGESCYDCGYTMNSGNRYYCEDCEHDFCTDCTIYCEICDTTVCHGCSFECPECGEYYCRHCTSVCSVCNEEYCNHCIGDEGICNNCLKEQENEDTTKTISAIQSDSMGQTRISA